MVTVDRSKLPKEKLEELRAKERVYKAKSRAKKLTPRERNTLSKRRCRAKQKAEKEALKERQLTAAMNVNNGLVPPSSPAPHQVIAAIAPQALPSPMAMAFLEKQVEMQRNVTDGVLQIVRDEQKETAAEADKQRAHVASENQKDREFKLELEKYKARRAFEASPARPNRELIFPPATPETPKPVETPAASNQKRPRDVHEDPPKKKRPCDYFYGPTAAGASKPAFNSQDLFGSSRPGAPYYEDSKLPAVQFGGVTAPVSQSQPPGVAPASVPPVFVGFSAPPAQAWQQNDPPSFVAFPPPPGEAMPMKVDNEDVSTMDFSVGGETMAE